jgi:hypothetical protein
MNMCLFEQMVTNPEDCKGLVCSKIAVALDRDIELSIIMWKRHVDNSST